MLKSTLLTCHWYFPSLSDHHPYEVNNAYQSAELFHCDRLSIVVIVEGVLKSFSFAVVLALVDVSYPRSIHHHYNHPHSHASQLLVQPVVMLPVFD